MSYCSMGGMCCRQTPCIYNAGTTEAEQPRPPVLRRTRPPRQCRPPRRTPDGAVCWLKHRRCGFLALRWSAPLGDLPAYWLGVSRRDTHPPAALYRSGWRFHGIAEVPADG